MRVETCFPLIIIIIINIWKEPVKKTAEKLQKDKDKICPLGIIKLPSFDS